MSEAKIVRLRRDNKDQVVAFLRRHYGDSYYGADERFFRWQYCEVPTQWFAAEASSGCLPANGIVDDQGDLLAVHVFIPFDGVGPAGGFRGAFDEEWINGSGIPGFGRRLAARLMDEVDVYCGFGCNDLSERAFRTLGFEFVPEIPRLVAVIDGNRLRTAIADAGYVAEAAFVPERDCRLGDRNVFVEIAVSDIPERAIESHNRSMGFGIRRTREWLRWRYERHPYIKYSVVAAPGEFTAGAAVVRIENIAGSGQCVARIVDLLGERMRWPSLFIAALSFARAHECVLADFFSSSGAVIDGIATALSGAEGNFSRNPRLPYMFQPLAFGAHNSINFAMNSKVLVANALFSAVKADGTQDIFRHPESGPQLQRRT